MFKTISNKENKMKYKYQTKAIKQFYNLSKHYIIKISFIDKVKLYFSYMFG